MCEWFEMTDHTCVTFPVAAILRAAVCVVGAVPAVVFTTCTGCRVAFDIVVHGVSPVYVGPVRLLAIG